MNVSTSSVPLCPVCNEVVAVKVAKRGTHSGREFGGVKSFRFVEERGQLVSGQK
ncbi:hypothetical protein D9M68_500060 [compost metagenome]